MIITKAKMAEQIQRIYVRFLHRDDLSPTLDKRELYELMEQQANKALHAQSVAGYSLGGIDVPTGSLMTYTIPVSQKQTWSEAELPVRPIRLPFDVGVWMIYDPLDPWNPFIPIIQMDAVLTRGNPEQYLEQQVGYYIQGSVIRFTKDLTISPYSLTEVSVVLLLNDFAQYTADEPLPITPEVADGIIQGVLGTLSKGQISQAELQKMEEQERQINDGENRDS